MKAQTYRHALKQQTHAQHARVDTLLSGLDIARREGFVPFLEVHLACFLAMTEIAGARRQTLAGLTEMTASLEADLATLNAPWHGTPVCTRADLSEIDPMALDYMLEGSRLGSQVLKRRWAASQDDTVCAANAYFSLQPVAGRWRAVCDALASVPVHSDSAARITKDTKTLFDLFYATALECGVRDTPSLEPAQ